MKTLLIDPIDLSQEELEEIGKKMQEYYQEHQQEIDREIDRQIRYLKYPKIIRRILFYFDQLLFD